MFTHTPTKPTLIQDFDPYGMLLVDRNFSITAENYRFGFNGYENTDELLGDNIAIDFGARVFDSRVARFFSIDPRSGEYPWQSVYVYYSNCPIAIVDVDGMGGPAPDPPISDANADYVVQAGDTPESIAKSLNVSVWDLANWNQGNQEQGGYFTDIGTYSYDEYWVIGEKTGKWKLNAGDVIQYQLPNYTNSYEISAEEISFENSFTIVDYGFATTSALLRSNPNVKAFIDQKIPIKYKGKNYKLSPNSKGTKHVPKDVAIQAVEDFKAKPAIKVYNFSEVGGIVLNSIGLGFSLYNMHQNGLTLDNGISTTGCLVAFFWEAGAVIYPAYLIANGVMDYPTAFFGTQSTGYDGLTLRNYSPSLCFVAGTKIAMKGNIEKNIEDIKPGDKVLTYNLNKEKIQQKRVKIISNPVHTFFIKICFENGISNINTYDHPYYVIGKGWCSYNPASTLQNYGIEVGMLTRGDKCYYFNGHNLIVVEILSLEELAIEQQSFNLTKIAKNHNFFANGILVHNKAH